MTRILFLLVLLPISALANGLPSYYPKYFKQKVLSGKSDRNIKRTLRRISSNAHKALTYKEARRIMFGKLHLKRNRRGYYVKDVYCRKVYGPNQKNELNVGPGIIPNSNVMNCEHTWPQSKFNPDYSNTQQKTDLHHLYPSNSRANSTRSNYNFAIVNGDVLSSDCTASSIGSPVQNFFRDYYFEPPKSHRGNVARAIFYFSVRYQHKINDDEEKTLRMWHKEDPVDKNELDRNTKIEFYQNNRNIFIDSPSLVDEIKDF